jgi:hypothetical protein
MLRLLKLPICQTNWTNLAGRVFFSQLGKTFNQNPSVQPRRPQQQLKTSFNNVARFLPFLQSELTGGGGDESSIKMGLFGKAELKSHEGFFRLKERAERNVNRLVNEAFVDEPLGGNRLGRKLVEIFDDISNELCCVADLAEFVRSSHPDDRFRQAANAAYASINQIVEKLNTNRELYVRLKESLDESRMEECDRRVCALLLTDFEQSGIHLDERVRERFVQVNDELVTVLMSFQVNSQKSSEIRIAESHPKFHNVSVTTMMSCFWLL